MRPRPVTSRVAMSPATKSSAPAGMSLATKSSVHAASSHCGSGVQVRHHQFHPAFSCATAVWASVVGAPPY